MDRTIVYPGAIPLETDLLTPEQNIMVALGGLMQGVIGTGTFVSGLACTPTIPATLSVQVAAGAIYSLATIEATPFGSLSADTRPLVKMGYNRSPTTLTVVPPGGSGQSIAYLVQAAFSETDAVPVVLPYYNAADPTRPYTGPANSGTAQNTQRLQTVTVQLKSGGAATTGSQTVPAVDNGFVPLFVITLANGATTVTAANIVQHLQAPYFVTLPATTGRLLRTTTLTAASGTFVELAATRTVKFRLVGGGAGGGGAAAAGNGQGSAAGGGGAGGYIESQYATTGGVSRAYLIGQGGAGGGAGTAGGDGGVTQISGIAGATGGSAGQGGLAVTPPAAGGNGGTGAIVSALVGANIMQSGGGSGQNGLVMGPLNVLGGIGGSSMLGAGGPQSGNGSGGGAQGPGAGGSGASVQSNTGSNRGGGAGANGIIILEEYN